MKADEEEKEWNRGVVERIKQKCPAEEEADVEW